MCCVECVEVIFVVAPGCVGVYVQRACYAEHEEGRHRLQGHPHGRAVPTRCPGVLPLLITPPLGP